MAVQESGTGAYTEIDDDQVRKEEILCNIDKAPGRPGGSLDGTDVRVDVYKDIPTNQRPKKDGDAVSGNADNNVDRPGFDLDGANGDTEAGKGLGLDTDAKEGRKDWGLPR